MLSFFLIKADLTMVFSTFQRSWYSDMLFLCTPQLRMCFSLSPFISSKKQLERLITEPLIGKATNRSAKTSTR
jgi:hypothetical protein